MIKARRTTEASMDVEEKALIVDALIEEGLVHCTTCNGLIVDSLGFKPHQEEPSLNGFDVILMCGTCKIGTTVNESGFKACVRQ